MIYNNLVDISEDKGCVRNHDVKYQKKIEWPWSFVEDLMMRLFKFSYDDNTNVFYFLLTMR